MKHRSKHVPAPRRCRGFSLVELMVALVITLILMAGVSQIFLGSKQSYTLQDQMARMQENGRYAIETLAADLRRAGYMGGNADISKITDNTPEGISNGFRTATEDGTCSSANTNWARMLESAIYGKDDNRSGYTCLPTDTTHKGDILVVRYAAPWIVGGITTQNFDANQYYIRSSLFEGRLFRGQDETNTANNIPSAAAVRTSELVANGYFIHKSENSDADKCPGSDAVPSLYRIALRGGTSGAELVAEEIAYGVDQFQVQYGLDNKDSAGNPGSDGSVDEYKDAPLTATEWNQVVAARIWLLTRAECPEFGYTNEVSYDLGNLVGYKPNDGYRRQLFTSTVSLRN